MPEIKIFSNLMFPSPAFMFIANVNMFMPTPRTKQFFIYYVIVLARFESQRPEPGAEDASKIPDNFFGVH